MMRKAIFGFLLLFGASVPALALPQNASEYEAYRRERAANAPNVEEFLRWATPQEIQKEFNIPTEAMQPRLADRAESAEVNIKVSLSAQTITASSPDFSTFTDRAATGRPGYETPSGCYKPIGLDANYFSQKYQAPMPNSVFFLPGIALHEGDVDVQSHGCVHLSAEDSLKVFDTVKAHYGSTIICIE